MCSKTRRRAFNLVELVLVISIIGTLAAIAIPRISSAANNSRRNSVQMSLVSVRKAIDAYYAEHGKYPGYNPATGAPNNFQFVDQLMMFSDASGRTHTANTYPYIYGPYLRPPFPVNPINKLNTVHVKATPATADPASGSAGWVAVLSHGYFGILADTADLEDAGLDAIENVKGGAKVGG